MHVFPVSNKPPVIFIKEPFPNLTPSVGIWYELPGLRSTLKSYP
jgi:hypothetical protein